MRGGLGLGVVMFALVSACGTPDGVGDGVGGANNVSIGFTQTIASGDETENEVDVFVSVSEPADHTITAQLTLGGTATPGDDYTVASGPLLVLFPGDPNTFLVLQIFQDNKPEQDETIELHLTDVDGATVDNGTFTYTIRNNVLPRIQFGWPYDATPELTAFTPVEVTVLPASPVPITLDLALSGTATADDYTLPSLPITIPAGATSVQIPVGHINDSLDEDDETLIMTLANPVNAIVGATPTHTHLIEDDDPNARIQFTVEQQTVSEGDSGMKIVTATAQLDRVVGRTLTVPFTITSTNQVAGTDFAVLTSSPLTFAPGTTSQTISVAVYGDSALDGSGEIRLELSYTQQTDMGWPYMHRIVVATDDCVGVGAYAICPDQLPTTTLTFNDSVSTYGSYSCATTQPPGWTAAGNPDACFIYARDIVINSVRVMGNRPVVFFATNSITVNSLLDAGSHDDSYAAGAGSQPTACAPFASTPASGAGGAGGTFVTAGGSGGDHGQGAGGQPAAASGAPTFLRGGCMGQQDDTFASPGRGGGAVYLFAMSSITIAAGATVNASGAPGEGAGYSLGGSGGGSGGMIVLWAPTIQASSARLLANGGGGGEGSPANLFGTPGSEVNYASPTTPAAGGTGTSGGDGGAGAAQGAAAGNGASANNNNGGGAGGGGLGYILTSQSLTGALVSPAPVPL